MMYRNSLSLLRDVVLNHWRRPRLKYGYGDYGSIIRWYERCDGLLAGVFNDLFEVTLCAASALHLKET